MLKVLAAYGASLHSQSTDGSTALKLATNGNHAATAEWLSRAMRQSPFEIATESMMTTALQWLVEHGTAANDYGADDLGVDSLRMIADSVGEAAAAAGAVSSRAASVDPTTRELFYQYCCQIPRPWRWTNHLMFHPEHRASIHHMLLVAQRLAETPGELPVVPPELWLYMFRFVGRRGFEAHPSLAIIGQ